MASWRDSYKDLRDRFVARAFKRLDEMSAVVGLLQGRPADTSTMRELLRHFHWFAGQGTTYGFPEATRLGLEGETHCQQIVNDSRSFNGQDAEKLHALIEAIREHMHQATGDQDTVAESGSPDREAKPFDILIVDAEQESLLEMTRLLEDCGMAVRSARTISGALASIGSAMPDAIIVEALLPDGNGYELSEQLRQLPGGDRPVIIIVSRLSGFVDKVRAIHCGADAYFEKTANWERMVARLRFLLEKQRVDPYKILSVEDEPDQALFIRQFLQSAGYDVRTCTDPHKVEESLVAFKPDLLLLDVVMPGVSGYEVARYVRQDDRYTTLPVVFLTARGSVDHVIEAAKSGVDAHLVKPVDPQLLLATVASHLERSRLLKSLLYRDGLTRLLTHSTFLEQAKALVAGLRRHYDRTAALALIDMDHFKSVNAEYGHPVGDKVLSALATLLRQRLRQSDLVGRYSGQQFAVILEELEEFEAVNLMEKLLADFAAVRHHDASGVPFSATFSAGIAMFGSRTMDVDQWFEAAQKALAAAKKAGRSCVRAATRPGTTVGA
jgi:diguanylate cyclase (GGDEF)-like protein